MTKKERGPKKFTEEQQLERSQTDQRVIIGKHTKQKKLTRRDEYILFTLESQAFADFYRGRMFEDYITGFANAAHKEKVLEQIRKLFGLNI